MTLSVWLKSLTVDDIVPFSGMNSGIFWALSHANGSKVPDSWHRSWSALCAVRRSKGREAG
jgi:hypothetical protein